MFLITSSSHSLCMHLSQIFAQFCIYFVILHFRIMFVSEENLFSIIYYSDHPHLIVLEYMSNGSLESFLKVNGDG